MYFSLFIAVLFIIEAFNVMLTGMIGDPLYGNFYVGSYRYIISVSFLIFSIYCFYITYLMHQRNKNKQETKTIEFSICPKCKETFHYEELENGKCKFCANIDTVDIEEYYKK